MEEGKHVPVVCRPVENETERSAAMDVRVEVFVVEQGCPPEEESDEFDAVALHFVAVAGDRVVGTARAYEMDGCAKIGRVAVKRSHRGQGIGAALMEAAHAWARESGFSECILHAQTPVIGFYASLGYRAEGEEFYEADIPHYRMRRKIT